MPILSSQFILGLTLCVSSMAANLSPAFGAYTSALPNADVNFAGCIYIYICMHIQNEASLLDLPTLRTWNRMARCANHTIGIYAYDLLTHAHTWKHSFYFSIVLVLSCTHTHTWKHGFTVKCSAHMEQVVYTYILLNWLVMCFIPFYLFSFQSVWIHFQ